MKTVVVGIGNRDRGDDGAGPEVIARLRSRRDLSAHDGARLRTGVYEHVGTGEWEPLLVESDPSRLTEHLEGAEVAIIVDACQGAGDVGSVRIFDHVPTSLGSMSSHGISVSAAVELAGMLYGKPTVLRCVLIEGSEFDVGAQMSQQVLDAVEVAATEVERELDRVTPRIRYRLHAIGIVQGVGFRPFVYRLATELELSGFVLNSPQGVFVEVEGPRHILERFVERLKNELPPPAVLSGLTITFLDSLGFDSFEIRDSGSQGVASATIIPDLAVCSECLREMNDPTNRRYRYPFINCTHCGPRYSIVTGLPYDRPLTSMVGFQMCSDCKREYEDPLDRRYHAQPIACPSCGPQLAFWEIDGCVTAIGEQALQAALKVVRDGGTLALKGIGGFQLIVDARNEDAVARLRQRKRRYAKPMAVMVQDASTAHTVAEMTRSELELLTSPEAPIVLLRSKPSNIAASVAPEMNTLGVMLPYSPLHHLLLAELGFPVVATSGNLSEEPICICEREALEILACVADGLLVHNRPIVRPIDDSVARVMGDRPVVLRRARGYAPLPCLAPDIEPGWLGVGAHLKGSVAISVPNSIVVGQFVGELQNTATRRRLETEAADLQRLYQSRPVQVCHDLHPDYASTQFAESLGLPRTGVQHHVAHAAACIAENDLREPVLAVVWDGTGYGTDGSIWGGEFFRIDESQVSRVGTIRPFQLIGGDVAARESRRSALSILVEVFGDTWPLIAEQWAHEAFPEGPRFASNLRVLAMNKRGTKTTSAGRLFDAFASLGAGLHESRFEGDVAMRFESMVRDQPCEVCRKVEAGVEMKLDRSGSFLSLDWAPILSAVLDARQRGEESREISRIVHMALANAIVAVAKEIGVEAVALSGGCFQNAVLHMSVFRGLAGAGFRPYGHQRIPPNDEGISLGQVVAASRGWRLESCV